MNKVHDNDIEGAKKSAQQAQTITDQLEDRSYADKIKRFLKSIFGRKVKVVNYPVQQKHIRRLIN